MVIVTVAERTGNPLSGLPLIPTVHVPDAPQQESVEFAEGAAALRVTTAGCRLQDRSVAGEIVVV